MSEEEKSLRMQARKSFVEFFTEKLSSLDDSYTKSFLKKEEAEKELESINKQIMHMEGFITYYRRFMKEWALYQKDTQRMLEAERRREAALMTEANKQNSKAKAKTTKKK